MAWLAVCHSTMIIDVARRRLARGEQVRNGV